MFFGNLTTEIEIIPLNVKSELLRLDTLILYLGFELHNYRLFEVCSD